MKDLMRTTVAGAVGALLALAVVTTPALAGHAERAAQGKVTSKGIKNGTIKRVDLNADVAGALARADSALQGIPNGSVSTQKLTDNAVTSPKIAGNAVGSSDLADNSVGTTEVQPDSLLADDLAANSVGSAEVADGSLTVSDVAKFRGSRQLNYPNLTPGACSASAGIDTGLNLDGDLIVVSNPATVSGSVQMFAHQEAPGGTSLVLVACSFGATFDPPNATFTFAVLEN